MAGDGPSESKSIKLWWGSIGSGDVLGIIFGERNETVRVAGLMIDLMKRDVSLSITRRDLRTLAVDFGSGKLGVKYSYHNFYAKLVRKLVNLGFVDKCLIWNPHKRTTQKVHQLRIQPIPDRPPPSSFVRSAWQIARAWNDLVLAH